MKNSPCARPDFDNCWNVCIASLAHRFIFKMFRDKSMFHSLCVSTCTASDKNVCSPNEAMCCRKWKMCLGRDGIACLVSFLWQFWLSSSNRSSFKKSAITFQNVSNTQGREISDAQRRLKSWATQKCQPKVLNVFRVQERNISRIVWCIFNIV